MVKMNIHNKFVCSECNKLLCTMLGLYKHYKKYHPNVKVKAEYLDFNGIIEQICEGKNMSKVCDFCKKLISAKEKVYKVKPQAERGSKDSVITEDMYISCYNESKKTKDQEKDQSKKK